MCFESASLVLVFHMACNDGETVKINNIFQPPPLCFRYSILTMERVLTFRRLSFSYGGKLHDSEESESLLGGQGDHTHGVECLYMKKRGGSTSSFNSYKPSGRD